ncbi:putative glycosidase [Hyphodiscus hymeniophilus]|uniref:Glycosidase n=1 Tax=Hyphodiscus hymeniophilus TaxID=353542 RepID=A0A9P7AXA6_9HELO|nr:putative glycosidase [Hyphodiscus hymeniophilus]
MTPQPQLGTLTSTDCDANVNYNAGCNILADSTSTYGSDFNANGGGVFATEWTSDHIKIWFFPRGSIPQNIINGTPDPSTWTEPQANFQGGTNCDIDSHFGQNQIIFDTTFCGDYGDATWPSDQTCVCGGQSECLYECVLAGQFGESVYN